MVPTTLVHAAPLHPLQLVTFVHAARLPSTSSTCVRTRYKASLVPTAVLQLYMLCIGAHYRWLDSYMLQVHRQHRRPAFVRVAEHRWYALLSYIRTCCACAAISADYIRTRCSDVSTPLTCIRTRCRTSLIRTAVLHSYMLRVCRHYRGLNLHALLGYRQHRRAAFVRTAEPRWYAPLFYIRTRCSSTVNLVHLHSHTLQNLVDTHRCPTFVHAARLPPLLLTTFPRAARMLSTPLTCVRTHCRTSLVRNAVLHSYLLRVCRHYR